MLCTTLIIMIVCLLSKCRCELQMITELAPGNTLDSVSGIYDHVTSTIECAALCKLQFAKNSDCYAYSFDKELQICKLSGVPSRRSNETAGAAHDLTSLDDGTMTMTVRRAASCRAQYLQPVEDVTLSECAQIHIESNQSSEDFSYDPVGGSCYPILPLLPTDFSCTTQNDIYVLTITSRNLINQRAAPVMINIYGDINSSPSYPRGIPAQELLAFDGDYGNHWLSELNYADPWIGGDIGAEKIIAGAKFYARASCCAKKVKNLHFLVASEMADLTAYNEACVCSIYPGPPTHPLMVNADVVWFPCPFKKARYVKFLMIFPDMMGVAEIELFGYEI